MNDYTKLRIWKEGIDLVEEVCKASSAFPSDERFGLTSQIRRSAGTLVSKK